MAKTSLKRRVMHRPSDLIELVSDVEKYPEFINLLSALRVTKRMKKSETVEVFEAEATVSYKFISETFMSKVTVDRGQNQILVEKAGKGGAVKSLENLWVFHELSDGSTLVDFFVSVKLKAFPLEMLLRDKFEKIGDHMMDLFQKKAHQTLEKVGDANLQWNDELPMMRI